MTCKDCEHINECFSAKESTTCEEIKQAARVKAVTLNNVEAGKVVSQALDGVFNNF